jgi:hypothetical protein
MSQDLLKIAYDTGAQAALEDLGLSKSAGILDFLKRLSPAAAKAEPTVAKAVAKNPYGFARPNASRKALLDSLSRDQLAALKVTPPPLATLSPSLERLAKR